MCVSARARRRCRRRRWPHARASGAGASPAARRTATGSAPPWLAASGAARADRRIDMLRSTRNGVEEATAADAALMRTRVGCAPPAPHDELRCAAGERTRGVGSVPSAPPLCGAAHAAPVKGRLAGSSIPAIAYRARLGRRRAAAQPLPAVAKCDACQMRCLRCLRSRCRRAVATRGAGSRAPAGGPPRRPLHLQLPPHGPQRCVCAACAVHAMRARRLRRMLLAERRTRRTTRRPATAHMRHGPLAMRPAARRIDATVMRRAPSRDRTLPAVAQSVPAAVPAR